MSAHTKGPWVISGGGSLHLSVLSQDDEQTIADVWFIRRDPEEGNANARLIAAAPTMFEEIEREYTELADIRNQWEGRHTLEGQQKLCRLRDLICLVTGRDQMDVQDDYGNRLIRATGEQP